MFKQENIKSYTDTFGIDYKIGDHVYMDINKPNQPFAIACVLDFKLVWEKLNKKNAFLKLIFNFQKKITDKKR